jgi:tripartite-type tricarboxylate transporter receptor subunit TctC
MKARYLALCLMILAVMVSSAAAQTATAPYPAKIIQLVTGSQPAGNADVTARAIQQQIVPVLGAQMIIINRPGVAGMMANEFVARAVPDGYTILLQPSSFIAISTQLNTKTPWHPLKYLAPIIQTSSYDLVFVANPSVPATTVKQLIEAARAKPGAISFASTGVGSNLHLAGELLKQMAGIDMLHVPYRGSPPAVIDLLGGQVDTMFVHMATVLDHIKSGRLRPLGVTGVKRNPLLPNVPTISEAALQGYEVVAFDGVYAPAGTPREVIAKLNSKIASVLAEPALRQLWAVRGVEFVPNTPEQFAATTRGDYDKAAALIKAAGIKIQ